jgi:hypothetical protein
LVVGVFEGNVEIVREACVGGTDGCGRGDEKVAMETLQGGEVEIAIGSITTNLLGDNNE